MTVNCKNTVPTSKKLESNEWGEILPNCKRSKLTDRPMHGQVDSKKGNPNHSINKHCEISKNNVKDKNQFGVEKFVPNKARVVHQQ